MSVVVSEHDEQRLSYGKYVFGFTASVLLTVTAYLLATQSGVSKTAIGLILAGLAVVQFTVQLLFFLHVGEERKPRWRRLTLVLMLFFVAVVVLGSIWVMYNLNYRMSPQQMNQYMQDQINSGL